MLNFEKSIVKFCAPTLAGIKMANLFRYRPLEKESMTRMIFSLNESFKNYGVKVEILKYCAKTGYYLIYVFRPKELIKIVNRKSIKTFLLLYGYRQSEDYKYYLSILSNHICLNESFPHEIGIFLGYPLHDVVGFIEHKGENFCLCGYWKVYKNQSLAEKTFINYRLCTKTYTCLYEHGQSLTQLTVAV